MLESHLLKIQQLLTFQSSTIWIFAATSLNISFDLHTPTEHDKWLSPNISNGVKHLKSDPRIDGVGVSWEKETPYKPFLKDVLQKTHRFMWLLLICFLKKNKNLQPLVSFLWFPRFLPPPCAESCCSWMSSACLWCQEFTCLGGFTANEKLVVWMPKPFEKWGLSPLKLLINGWLWGTLFSCRPNTL